MVRGCVVASVAPDARKVPVTEEWLQGWAGDVEASAAFDTTVAHDPHGIVARLVEAVPRGSWLAVYHPASDIDQYRVGEAVRRVNARTAGSTTLRSHAEIARFFDGLQLLEPGLVQVHRWQPGSAAPDDGEQIAAYAGLARKF
jgi:S-adenosyl methyltransferase